MQELDRTLNETQLTVARVRDSVVISVVFLLVVNALLMNDVCVLCCVLAA